ncbi:MAG: cytochrome P450 [Kibdelosporangium sp.]
MIEDVTPAVFDPAMALDPAPQAVEMQAVDPVPVVRLPDGRQVRLATRYDDVWRVLDEPGLVPVRQPPAVPAFTSDIEELFEDMVIRGAPVDFAGSVARTLGVGPCQDVLVKSVLLFGRHPDQWALLTANPALVGQAVDELLRYVGQTGYPVTATAPLTLSGVPVQVGETILPLVALANRDPIVFPDPDRFDLTRPDAGLHLTFGRGPDASRAKDLLCAALTALLTKFPTLRSSDPDREPDWTPRAVAHGHPVSCGLKSLPVAW